MPNFDAAFQAIEKTAAHDSSHGATYLVIISPPIAVSGQLSEFISAHSIARVPSFSDGPGLLIQSVQPISFICEYIARQLPHSSAWVLPLDGKLANLVAIQLLSNVARHRAHGIPGEPDERAIEWAEQEIGA